MDPLGTLCIVNSSVHTFSSALPQEEAITGRMMYICRTVAKGVPRDGECGEGMIAGVLQANTSQVHMRASSNHIYPILEFFL